MLVRLEGFHAFEHALRFGATIVQVEAAIASRSEALAASSSRPTSSCPPMRAR